MEAKKGVFRYADNIDRLLLLFGTLGSIGDGLMMPLTMILVGGMINNFDTNTQSQTVPTIDIGRTGNQYALKLLYLSLGVGIAAFVEGLCWTRTAERQTSRLRMQYLKSVLRQEVAFFDNQGASSSTFQVISGLTTDADTIQVTISEKIPHFVSNTTTYVACFIVSFTLSWRLTLFTFPLIFFVFVPMMGFGKKMKGVALEMNKAYEVAGEIAEQAISSIRTVYSFVGENQTLSRFNQALNRYLELAIKQGLTKGLMIGCTGLIYIHLSFQSWIGGVLVAEKRESSGHIFIAGLSVIIGGMHLMVALSSISYFIEVQAAATRTNKMISRIPLIDWKQ